MVKPLNLFIKFLLIFITSSAIAQGEALMPHDYICVAEASTGFSYDDGEWNIRSFNANKRKYLIRLLTESQKNGYYKDSTAGVFPLGEKHPLIGCIFRDDKIICKAGKFGEMYISTQTKRFIQSYPIGYWLPGRYNQNSPNITRGTCSELE